MLSGITDAGKGSIATSTAAAAQKAKDAVAAATQTAKDAAAAKALQLQVDGLTGQLRETQATAAATVERLQQEQQTMQLAMTTVERQLAEAQERYERCGLPCRRCWPAHEPWSSYLVAVNVLV